MKNLRHHMWILMLALTTFCIVSCSEELEEADCAQVSFTATLPQESYTRSFGDAGQINTMVVGVYKKVAEKNGLDNGNDEQGWSHVEVDRKLCRVSGTSVNIHLSLTKNQNYSIVFWAYDDHLDIYDTEDLTAIRMKELPKSISFTQAESMDVFFAAQTDLVVNGNHSCTIELVRPLAQINVGTTETPQQASFTVKDVPHTFHPLTNTVSGTTNYTWNFSETTTETFYADSKQYNYLAIGYLFASPTPAKVISELTLTDGETSKTVQFNKVKVEANCRSNIVGRITLE